MFFFQLSVNFSKSIPVLYIYFISTDIIVKATLSFLWSNNDQFFRSTNTELTSILVKIFFDQSKVKVDEKQIEPFLPDIYSKLEWLSREDLIKHFVSAEFNKFLDYYNKSKDIKSEKDNNKPYRERSKSRTNLSNLSINIGRKNGVTPIELISLVNRVIKSNEMEIGAIDIRESYTIFEIDRTITKSLIKSSSKLDYNGTELKVSISKEKIEKKYKREKNEGRSKNKRDYKSKSRSRNRSKNRSESRGKRRFRD